MLCIVTFFYRHIQYRYRPMHFVSQNLLTASYIPMVDMYISSNIHSVFHFMFLFQLTSNTKILLFWWNSFHSKSALNL